MQDNKSQLFSKILEIQTEIWFIYDKFTYNYGFC